MCIRDSPDFVRAVSAAVAKCSPKSIPVAGERGPILVRIRDITYIEVFSYKTIIHTSKEQYQVRTPLKEFEGTLWGNGFARPHNSFLVNLDFVDRIQKANLLLTDGTETVSYTHLRPQVGIQTGRSRHCISPCASAYRYSTGGCPRCSRSPSGPSWQRWR